MLPLGEVIADRFEIERLAASGGMGDLYRARDRETDRAVAVKVMRAADSEVARFVREANILAELHHPHIVSYLTHGRTAAGELYLAMEWLEGEDLGKRLAGTEIAVDEAVAIGTHAAGALAAAHARGIVHRDVKPSNLFLVDWRVSDLKLLDFGVARLVGSELTSTGQMVGTPQFMAPEQARGEGVDARVDVFALGAVLFRCLARRAPFPAESVGELIARLLSAEEAPRIRALVPEVPAELDALVARMLAKECAARPRDAAEVLADLRSFGGGTGLGQRSPVASGTASWSEGALVAGRFRIVRWVAGGGMGDVYEAQDELLRERVALKTLRRASESGRFLREVQLSRRVTHRNVCRVFDAGTHAGVSFVAMELVDGETLAERLRRAGSLSRDAMLDIVRQVAAGIDAAHAAGIVHRDLKPGNILLSGDRAVVSDFGVASAPDAGGPADTPAGLVGTPAYVAPEQIAGGEVTGRSDIYALGIVLYQMVTGQLPFQGDHPLGAAQRRLREPPPSPRTLVPRLERRWEAAILRCLAIDPARRFAHGGELVRALEGRGPTRGRGWALAGLAAALIAALAAVVIARRPSVGAPVPASLLQRRTIAILGFANLDGRPQEAWISAALAELMDAQLDRAGPLRTLRENTTLMKVDLGLVEPSDGVDAQTRARIRNYIGADWLLSGSFRARGDHQLDGVVRLEDSLDGTAIASATVSGSDRELAALARRAGAELREKLRVAAPALERPVLPRNPDAVRLFAESIWRAERFADREALDLLTQAATIEADSPLIHEALADAWERLGVEPKVQEEEQRAFNLSGSLPADVRLAMEARYRAGTNEWDRAIEIQRALFVAQPDRVELGLGLLGMLDATERRGEARALTLRLAALPPPFSDDPRLDLEIGQHTRVETEAEAAFARARAKASSRGVRSITVELKYLEMTSAINQGDLKRAQELVQEMVLLHGEARDIPGLSNDLLMLSHLRLWSGDLRGAFAFLLQLRAIALTRGDLHLIAHGMLFWSRLSLYADRLDEAHHLALRALSLYRQTCIHSCEGVSMVFLADVALADGRPEAAEGFARDAFAVFARHPRPDAAALAHTVLGSALLARGDVEGARAEMEAAERNVADGYDYMDGWHWLLRARVVAEAGVPMALEAAGARAREALRRYELQGRYDQQLAARLLLAELELRRDPRAGRAALLAVEREATERGFHYFARRAREARAGRATAVSTSH